MTTSDDVRDELGRIAPERRCDRLAELSALFHSAGSLHLRSGGEWALQLDLGSGSAARRAFSLLRGEGIQSELRTYRRRAFGRETRYQLHVRGSEPALQVLVTAGVLDRRHGPLVRPPARVAARRCCRRAYVRGAFLGGGSLSLRHDAHLELRAASPETAAFLRTLTDAESVPTGIVHRDAYSAVYAKSWDAVETLLAAMGAADAVLGLEERAVLAATRGEANRRANADHANLVRTTRAAESQLAAIVVLAEHGELERLPTGLQEAARLRRRFPAGTLRELSARADPPASRAALHRRLRRLEELARGSSGPR